MKLVKEDHAQVITQAEYIFLMSLLLGFLINFFWPIHLPLPKIVHIPLGIVVVMTGVVIYLLSAQQFQKARTYSSPYKPAKSLITTGPYMRFRHPMYLGRLLQHIGMGVAFGNIWILILVIPALLIVWFGVIIPEECYLERRFGQKYLKYKNSTTYGLDLMNIRK
jgi:protein-S-isoprenylcysteine O-methyltransferase Ste14